MIVAWDRRGNKRLLRDVGKATGLGAHSTSDFTRPGGGLPGAMEQIGEGLDEASPATNSRPGDRSRRFGRVLAAIMLSILVATPAWAAEPRLFRIRTAGTTVTSFHIRA